MDQIPKGFSHGAGNFSQRQNAGPDNAASFGKEALYADASFISTGGRLCDPQPASQPSP
jgi:hypothetical protein